MPEIFRFEDPFEWFKFEFQKAEQSGMRDPNAMQLATVDADGFPQVRTVLFKGFLRGAFSFYTNYDSPKAHDLSRTSKAGLNFFWADLEQQIRLRGLVEKATRAESEAYFRTRPRLSQIGAWASRQSSEMPNFAWFEDRVKEFDQKFQGQDIPCPPNWGGFLFTPLQFEFWFGKTGRLHERYVFERESAAHEFRHLVKSP